MTKARDVLGSLLPEHYVEGEREREREGRTGLFFLRLSQSEGDDDDDGGAVPAVISFVVPLT